MKVPPSQQPLCTRKEFCRQLATAEGHNMVPRRVQVVDHVVEDSDKSSSNQRFIPYGVLIGTGITLNARTSTVYEDQASKINSHEFNLTAF